MNYILPALVALPLAAAVPSFVLSLKNKHGGIYLMSVISLLVTIAAAFLFASGQDAVFSLDGVVGFSLTLKADGFRKLYALIASLMWLMTSLFSIQYLDHGHAQGRYSLFTLLTLGATLGVFLSDDLITAFLFFEILSFTSYCWVIHEENPGAMRAGQTYLAIAILGGMTMLMGLMMLHAKLGSLSFEALSKAVQNGEAIRLYLPGALILAGFGAKAGMFPLHVWLPKAHPVAPAPASALLSGVLTKVGIYGILVISTRMFFGDLLWGNLLLFTGLVNMLLGALLALFSTDLKRTLACSSMSQIGFILFGIGAQSLLGEHNALAAQGTVLHMLNHSLIKLLLFMAAGVIYFNTHHLGLNDIRGYGRKRPFLMVFFLIGAASISGIPFFSGYASKTLLHESIIEYINHLLHLGHSAFVYQAAEWLFVITGGLTFCYMIKLFVAIFVEKHPSRQEEYDQAGKSMTPVSFIALGGSALLLLLLGLHPEGWLTALATRALPFLHAHPPEHEVRFLTWVNLSGGLKSLALGAVLYPTLVRKWMMAKDEQGQLVYVNRWPAWLDLEEKVYRPFVSILVLLGTALCRPLDILMDRLLIPLMTKLGALFAIALNAVEHLVPGMLALMTFLSRVLESLVEWVTLLLMKSVFKQAKEGPSIIPYNAGNRFTFTLGRVMDRSSYLLRKLFALQPRQPNHYVLMYAAIWSAARDNIRRMARTLSFGLILFALALVALLAYLLAK